MNFRLIAITHTLKGQVAADKINGTVLPFGGTLVGVSVFAGALTGSPTNVKIDVMEGTTELIADAVTITAAGGATWKTTHFGGANAPIALTKDANLSIDVKFTGGSTPSVTGDVTLWILTGEV
jgi:hypothetical protein